MAVFALLGFVPLLAYAVVQTIRDLQRKSWIMVAWGALMCAMLFWLVYRVGANPGY